MPAEDRSGRVTGARTPVIGGGSGGPGAAARAAGSARVAHPVDAAPGGTGPVGERGTGPVETLDGTGLLVAPGFIDLQCNGAMGVDLASEPERLWEVAAALPRWGVTAWLPTVVSSPAEVRRRALAALRAGPPPGRPVAWPLGLHLEGPFLAPRHRGAHDPRHLAGPSTALIEDEGWSAAAGVALVTLAPELPGALEVVRALADSGVAVAAGHSGATAGEAAAAVDAGVRYVTHVFNGMAPMHHRRPGLAGVALTDERLRVGLVADGVHVDPTVVAVAARALGARLNLVTDAVAALGLPPRDGLRWSPGPLAAPGPGEPPRRGAAAPSGGGAVRLPGGTLAGTTLSLDRAVRNLVAYAGVPLADAVAAVTTTPAAVLGLGGRGSVAAGAHGDLVLLTPAGEVVATVVGGRVAYDGRVA